MNEIVAATTSALMGSRRLFPRDLAPVIGTSKATVYNKLSCSTPFTAAEVAMLADFFGVAITDFYDGMGGRVGPTPGGGVVNPRYGRVVAFRREPGRTTLIPLITPDLAAA